MPASSTPAPASTPVVMVEPDKDAKATEDRAIAKKQQAVFEATQSIAQGKKAEAAGDYAQSKQIYMTALAVLTPARITRPAYVQAVEGLIRSNDVLIQLAQEKGDTDTMLLLYQNSLTYEPNNTKLQNRYQALQKAVKDPTNTTYLANPAMTPLFKDKVETVKNLFIEAEDFRRVGNYNESELRLKKIISLDPYNEAAQKQLDKLIKEKMDYAESARQQTRADRLDQIEKEWEQPVKRAGVETPIVDLNSPIIRSTQFDVMSKLKSIILPSVDFDDSTLQDAVNFLNAKSKELDNPSKEGVNFIPRPEALENSKPITLHIRNMPLGDALRYITNLANVKTKMDPSGIFIVPLTEVTDILVRRTFTIPPSFFPTGGVSAGPSAPSGIDSSTGAAVMVAAVAATGGTSNVTDALKDRGVLFSAPGSTAIYLPSQGVLTVINTQDQIDLIEELVNAASGQTLMVDIESKLVEINQTDLNDISSNVTYNMFGALGNLTNAPTQFLPLQAAGPVGNLFGPGQVYGNPYVQQSATGGITQGGPSGNSPEFNSTLRGASGINANSLDALVHPTSTVPSRFELGGVMTGRVFTMLLTALSQKTSTDLLSSPSIRVRSGERATLDVSRTFYYPETFAPPQAVTLTNLNNNGNATVTITLEPPAAIPAFPESFAKQEIGVLMNVQPTVGGDNRTIDLSLVPEVTDFEGFINYGTPITIPDSAGIIRTISTNQIPQPVFNVRRVTTKVFVRDGYTVMLGGLIREDVQTINDKVPILGDIPMIGRLFQSKADQHVKKNLLIFVTARILRPDGELFNSPSGSTSVVSSN